jgi:hypothetical protein
MWTFRLVDVPFGGRSVRVKMFSGSSVGGRSVKAPFPGSFHQSGMFFQKVENHTMAKTPCRGCYSSLTIHLTSTIIFKFSKKVKIEVTLKL